MSEKEFNKRLLYPETLHLLEKQDNNFTVWSDKRIVNLRFLENYKNRISYTPKSQIRIVKKATLSPQKIDKQQNSNSPNPRLSSMINNMISNKKSQLQIRNRERSFCMFPTEVSISGSYRKLRMSKKY